MIKINKISGILLVFLGVIIPITSFTKYKVEEYQYETILDEKVENNDYYALLEIDPIRLRREIYEADSKYNHVDQNILLHHASVMPTGETASHVILAAHSGNGANAYFKDLYLLKVSDTVKLYYQGMIWYYEIVDIEYQEKTGILYLKEDFEQMITLITCTKDDANTQTVYYGILKDTKRI